MKPCFGYLRVSSLGQAGADRDGLVRQRLAIEKYAEGNGLIVVEFFQDAITGTTDLEDRPGLSALMAALGEVKCVIVENVSRLARDLMIQESIILDMQRNNVELLSTFEADLCSHEPTRILIRQILGAFAQYEKSQIVLKLRAAKLRARATNPAYREGRKFYGGTAAELATIGEILELHGNGQPVLGICDTLNAAGRTSRRGGKWFPTQVRRILARCLEGI
jgi:DNA invertase Pin-like site-specific DNA recombinase